MTMAAFFIHGSSGGRIEASGGSSELLAGASYNPTDLTSAVSNAELIG